jgi:hypothetical protein
VVDDADIVCLVGEGGELVALEIVVVIGHCVGEAADDGFGDVYGTRKLVWDVEERIRG